ncbi:hypothetical protein D3C76_1033130 [compost metagenome]
MDEHHRQAFRRAAFIHIEHVWRLHGQIVPGVGFNLRIQSLHSGLPKLCERSTPERVRPSNLPGIITRKKEFSMLLGKFALPTLCVLAILAGCGRNDPAAELDAAVQQLQDNLEAKKTGAVLEQLQP